MPLSNAERQRRYRQRRHAQQPVVRYRRPQDRRAGLGHMTVLISGKNFFPTFLARK